jgi:hypothetical protein
MCASWVTTPMSERSGRAGGRGSDVEARRERDHVLVCLRWRRLDRFEVDGSDNRITIEAVASIRISGNNNDGRYARAVEGKKKLTIRFRSLDRATGAGSASRPPRLGAG